MKAVEIENVLYSNDKQTLRVTLAVQKGYVYVSSREVVEKARAEVLDPLCIGFRLSDVANPKIHK